MAPRGRGAASGWFRLFVVGSAKECQGPPLNGDYTYNLPGSRFWIFGTSGGQLLEMGISRTTLGEPS